MRRALLPVFAAASFAVLVAACATKEVPSSPPAPSAAPAASAAAATPTMPTPATGSLHLGAPITEATAVSLSDITKSPKDYEGKVVTTTGTVFAVCQSMGCWMEIKDDKNTEAHVKLAGHKFFVPKTSSGHHARVQALVMKTNPDEECSKEAAEQTGKPVAKLELEATGVELD